MTDIVALSPTWIEPSKTVRGYLAAAISDNTRRAYRSDLHHFLDWGGAIPASDVTVAEYLAAHAGTLAVATLERRLAAISKAHTSQGLPTPTASELVRMTLRGIRRTHGRPQRQVAAATREDVLAMVAGLGDGLKDTRDRALLLVGFAGAFRRSELVALKCIPELGNGRRVIFGSYEPSTMPGMIREARLSIGALAELAQLFFQKSASSGLPRESQGETPKRPEFEIAQVPRK